MTTVQGVLFAVLIVMVLVWFACVRNLRGRLRTKHPATYDELELENIWTRHNARPTFALLRFLVRRQYVSLRDRELTRLSVFMRRFLVAYLILFGYLFITILRQEMDDDRAETTAAIDSPAEADRDKAFDLHRAQQWPKAIAAYDAVVNASGEDAEILYWRGMAHWKSAHFEQALRDFRRVIDLDPTHLEAHVNADRLLARQQRWDDILAMWNEYISRQPPNAEAHFERGGIYFHKGDMVAARADAAKACELGKAQACKMLERLKDR